MSMRLCASGLTFLLLGCGSATPPRLRAPVGQANATAMVETPKPAIHRSEVWIAKEIVTYLESTDDFLATVCHLGKGTRVRLRDVPVASGTSYRFSIARFEYLPSNVPCGLTEAFADLDDWCRKPERTIPADEHTCTDADVPDADTTIVTE